MSKKVFLPLIALVLVGCNTSMQEFFLNPVQSVNPYSVNIEPKPIKSRTVVICRGKQCAPAKLSMSKEYIHNSLSHLLSNNNHKTALICEADAGSRVCTETYVSIPISVGVTPAHMYLDSVRLSDVAVGRKNKQIDLTLNYNVTYNGQSADCIPAKTIAYAQTVNNIILEDSGYSCKMTAIGQSSIKTLLAIDYIDLDYGFIGGYYSIGVSGPAYGGGHGYLLIRLPKDAYPLAPALTAPGNSKAQTSIKEHINFGKPESEESSHEQTPRNTNVQIFPIKQ